MKVHGIILQKLEVTDWDFSQITFYFSEGIDWDYTSMTFYSSEAGMFSYQKKMKFSIENRGEFSDRWDSNDIVNDLRLQTKVILICKKQVMGSISTD